MTLQDLLYGVSNVGYNLGLPGAGISRPVGAQWEPSASPKNVYGGTYGSTGLSTYTNPAYTQPNTTPTGDVNQQIINGATSGGLTVDQVGSGEPLQTTTQPSPTGPGYDPTFSGQTVTKDGVTYESSDGLTWMVKNAQDARAATLAAIQQRLDLARQQAGFLRGQASDVYNYANEGATTTFADLLKRAEEAKNSSISNLNQEDVNVQNQYGTASGDVRRAMEGAVARNRSLARATNRLNSSFYDDRQAGTAETAARSYGAISKELAGKRAGIGTRITDTGNYYEQTATDLAKQEKDYKFNELQKYQTALQNANQLEQAGLIDSFQSSDAADQAFNSMLANISQYAQERALKEQELAAMGATGTSKISSFKPIDANLESTLGNTTGLNLAQNNTKTLSDAAVAQPSASAPTQFYGPATSALDVLLGNINPTSVQKNKTYNSSIPQYA